jgi:hypothetical protein
VVSHPTEYVTAEAPYVGLLAVSLFISWYIEPDHQITVIDEPLVVPKDGPITDDADLVSH